MNIVTIILFLVLLIIGGIYLIRTRVVRIMSKLLSVAFVLLIISILFGLFVPQIYTTVADFSLRTAGVYERFELLDENIPVDQVLDVPSSIWEFLTGGNGEEKETEEDTFFISNFYNVILEILSFFLRVYSLIFSFAGLILVLYLSYISSTVTDAANLKLKVKELEKRIKELEVKGEELKVNEVEFAEE